MRSKSEVQSGAASDCLAGGGDMGLLMRSKDWSETVIGDVDFWSPALRVMVSILLANGFPLLLWWGPSFCQLYNDAYRPVLGMKHPHSMGQAASECWPEIWHVIGPLIEKPFRGGEATRMDDIFLEINRHGFVEETHFTIAYSPVPDDTVPSRIGGVLATVHEITDKVVGERRALVLRDLWVRSSEAKTADQACRIAAETLAQHPKNVPFALLYLIDGDSKCARLAGAAGVEMGKTEASLAVDLGGSSPERTWPLGEALRSETMQIVEDLPKKLSHVPPGPWSEPPHSAIVLPIPSNTAHELAGLLVFGVSSRLRFDNGYRDFFGLVASQVATTITNTRAYENERKRAEEALRVREERFRRYFDLGLIGMAITSPAKGCLEANDELCRILGYERSELLRKAWTEITHPDDLAADVAQFNRVMAGEIEGYSMDKRWIRKDGRVIHSIMATQCLRRADRSVDCFVG